MERDWGPKPFRTIDAWLSEKGFGEMVKTKWNSYSSGGSGFINIKEKLKCLKRDLKLWNRDVFGNINTSKKMILQDIEDIDCQDCNGTMTENARLKRCELLSRLKEIDNKLDSLTCQKAIASWLKNGDSCTKFYHSTLRWRRLRNAVKGVEIGDQWCEEPSTVRREAKILFEKRFTATKDLGVRLDAVDFKTLNGEENLGLIVGFTKKEIRDVVWQCEGAKSPGLEGFDFNFLKKCWEVIKVEIVEAVEQFHENGTIPKGCNASFVALVPKVRDPSRLEQYRPISLVGVVYKIIAKLLAKRLKKVLPSVVDESQSAFLKDRGILDSVLMANEVVKDIRRRGRSGLCLKVDFEKAYNSVIWEFLYDMLQRMGFHHRWILWIQVCLGSASISVLVNGSPTEEFKPSRGLRQGDPLAPFLYLVVAEGLAGLVRQVVKTNILYGLKIGKKKG